MAITKILNIMESEGRNPASYLKNALEYIQNPDQTEECVLVGGINCLPDTAFEQMEETKNIFHKTGKRQGYHVIISFSPEEKVTKALCGYALDGKALLLFVGYQEIAQGEAVTIPEEVLCKAVSVKDCRTEAFCSRWSKVYRRFEAVSSVTGQVSVACE